MPKTKTQKRMQALIGGMILSGFINSFVNRLIDPDDWDQVSDYEKDTNWMIPLHLFGKKRYISIALPYGLNIFKAMGGIIEEYLSPYTTKGLGKAGFDVDESVGIDLGTAASRIAAGINDAFNPIGSSNPGEIFMPTAVRPLYQWWINENFYGAPIYKEQDQWAGYKPDSEMHFSGASQLSKFATKWVNDLTGGNELESGYISVNPETIDHFVGQIGGGLGKFAYQTISGTAGLAAGEVPPVNEIPIVRSFVKESSEWKAKSQAREMIAESERTLFGIDDQKRFSKHLAHAVMKEQITIKESNEMMRKFNKNQNELRVRRNSPPRSMMELWK